MECVEQLGEENATEEHLLADGAEQCVVTRRTYLLLPDASANLVELQQAVQDSADKLVGLATQWETHRAPLLQRYRQARQHNSNKAVSWVMLLGITSVASITELA